MALSTRLKIRLRQLICDFRPDVDHFHCEVKHIVSVVHQAFDQSRVLLRAKFAESVIEAVCDLMGVTLKLPQGLLEVTGIQATFLLKTPLHLPCGDNARGHFLVEQSGRVSYDLCRAAADVLDSG
jgi:hypothetical protein